MVDYIKEMEEDIKELNRLERRIGACAVKIKNILLESRQRGALFHFRYSNLEPDKSWFMENFERFKDKINLSPYYTIGTYGNPEEKKKLWDKQMEIKNELTKHLHEAFHLMAKWEFVYKTIIPWVKLTKHGKIHFGMGHYFRASHELCLFGVRGKLKTATNNTRNVLFAKRPSIHSGKPEEMYELIEANSPSPYLELFSRNTRPEWTMLGYDVDRRDVRESIQDLIE